MRIVDFVPPGSILFRLAARDSDGVVRELAHHLATQHGLDPEQVTALLLERERLGCTAIGQQIAIPHARFELPKTIGVIGLSEQGLDFGAPDGVPVRIVVAFLSPKQGGAHLHALAAVAQELADSVRRASLLAASTAAEVHEVLATPKRATRPPP